MDKKVRRLIKQHDLIHSGDTILVGVSGGPDSMALFSILNALKEDMGFSLVVAHINHGVRGQQADEDEAYVAAVCKKWHVPFYHKKIDMNVYAKENGLSSEEAGREIRYLFFREILKTYPSGKIAVAHNKNDQAETLIMRFFRGSGVDGLRGMAVKNGDVIRPLLDVTRKEIEDYCDQMALAPRIDHTNLEPIYRRNQIRLEMLPYIQQHFNPSIVDTLARTSGIMEKDAEFLIKQAELAYGHVAHLKEYGVEINIPDFKTLHPAIQSRVLRLAIEKIKGNLKGIEEKHLQNMLHLVAHSSTGKSIDIIEGLEGRLSYNELIIGKKQSKVNTDFKIPLEINTMNYIADLDAHIDVRLLSKADFIRFNQDRFIKYFDYDKIKGRLYIRTRKPGDRFVPFGMKGHKKLKDYFIDEKVPRIDRDQVPLVMDEKGILWVVGYRISDLYRIDASTENILVLNYRGEER